MWLLLLVLIGVAAYFVFSGKKLIRREDETPLEILKKRYAKGEVSKQEFEKMKKDVE
ncbi:MAG: SHOCT domain-containing protein [candidate division WOR-3 bacterium]|nr:MAG: SHOCT domain-containing protein [candidate division WOR-3 bacterium]